MPRYWWMSLRAPEAFVRILYYKSQFAFPLKKQVTFSLKKQSELWTRRLSGTGVIVIASSVMMNNSLMKTENSSLCL